MGSGLPSPRSHAITSAAARLFRCLVRRRRGGGGQELAWLDASLGSGQGSVPQSGVGGGQAGRGPEGADSTAGGFSPAASLSTRGFPP